MPCRSLLRVSARGSADHARSAAFSRALLLLLRSIVARAIVNCAPVLAPSMPSSNPPAPPPPLPPCACVASPLGSAGNGTQPRSAPFAVAYANLNKDSAAVNGSVVSRQYTRKSAQNADANIVERGGE